jgi:hypothetical protein
MGNFLHFLVALAWAGIAHALMAVLKPVVAASTKAYLRLRRSLNPDAADGAFELAELLELLRVHWSWIQAIPLLCSLNDERVLEALKLLEPEAHRLLDPDLAFIMDWMQIRGVVDRREPALRQAAFELRAIALNRRPAKDFPRTWSVLVESLAGTVGSQDLESRPLAIKELCQDIVRLAGDTQMAPTRDRLVEMYDKLAEQAHSVPLEVWPGFVHCLSTNAWSQEERCRPFHCIVDAVCSTQDDRGGPVIQLLRDLGGRAPFLPANDLKRLMQCSALFNFHGAEYDQDLAPLGYAADGNAPRKGRVWARLPLDCSVSCSYADGKPCPNSPCKPKEVSLRGFYAPLCPRDPETLLTAVSLEFPAAHSPKRRKTRVTAAACHVVGTHAVDSPEGRGIRIATIEQSESDALFDIIGAALRK